MFRYREPNPLISRHHNSVAPSKRAASLKRPRNKVDNHGLGNNTIRRADPLANKVVMDLVLLDVKVPIGHRVELHDEDVCEAILPAVSVWSTRGGEWTWGAAHAEALNGHVPAALGAGNVRLSRGGEDALVLEAEHLVAALGCVSDGVREGGTRAQGTCFTDWALASGLNWNMTMWLTPMMTMRCDVMKGRLVFGAFGWRVLLIEGDSE